MEEIKITPLGTVSPYPKDNKNCPGFLIEYENYKVLLDCGDGITRLLNLTNDFNNLIVIISHLHKDHYSGLSSLAYASYVYKNLGYLCDKIDVYIPKDSLEDYNYLMNFGDENYLNFLNIKNSINHGKMKITFYKNPHNINTHSTKIETKNFKIVYSSDTGFKNNILKETAKNADLLICESTFLKEQTKTNDNHLYAYEAGIIAKEANVKKLLLTHFWPEIDKQKYVDEATKYFKNTEASIEGKKLILRR